MSTPQHSLKSTPLRGIRQLVRATVFLVLGLLSSDLFAGDLTARFELTLDRVLKSGPPVYNDEFVLADAVPQHVRRFTEFSGDVSGRYIGAMAMATQFSGRQFPELDRIVGKLVKLQKADGHFGDPLSTDEITRSDMAILWGNGRMLIGLLEYHRVKPTPEVLASARRLGDLFVDLGPRLNTDAIRKQYSGDQVAVGYICWTQIIEGVIELYRVTKDDRYLRLAEQIAMNTQRFPREHSHGFVTTLRGILEMYRATGEARWLRQVEREWEGILASDNLLPHGALPEILHPRGGPRDEGCSEADWLRLNLALWTETRKPRYLDNAELTWFNEFSFNQFQTGDFGSRTMTDVGIAAGCARCWWCCTFHGLRAFPDVAHAAFHADSTTLCYDLPVDGDGAVEGLAMYADSELGQNASVTLTVVKTDGREHALRVRQPAWASAVEYRLDRQLLETAAREGSVEVRRAWKQGDTLTICYAMRTRLLPKPKDPKHVALLHGPWFLGVDESNSPRFYDEMWEENAGENVAILTTRDAADSIRLVPMKETASAGNRFTVLVARFTLNYLPAIYPIQRQTVLLHPIAEQTALPDSTPWTFWFQLKQ